MTRSRQNGKGDRIERAVARQHAMVVGWFTAKHFRDQAVARAKEAKQPSPSMYVGKEPAPVVHFISMKLRGSVPFCRGRHVRDAECVYASAGKQLNV